MRLMKSHGSILGSLSLASLLFAGCNPETQQLLEGIINGDGTQSTNPPATTPGDPTTGTADSSGCMSYDWGVSATCMDYGEAKKKAMAKCEQNGMEVKTQQLTEECADGRFQHLVVNCCKVEPPPPANDGCQVFKDGGATTCKSGEEWRQAATAGCKAVGLELSTWVSGEVCGENSYRYSQYNCCKAVPTQLPPSPPRPASCVTKLLDGTCQSAVQWKQQATDTCQAASLTLTYYETPAPCADGTFSVIKFDCCQLDANGNPI
jgi:hypothetical protein